MLRFLKTLSQKFWKGKKRVNIACANMSHHMHSSSCSSRRKFHSEKRAVLLGFGDDGRPVAPLGHGRDCEKMK